MNLPLLKATLEAILYVAEEPVTLEMLQEAFPEESPEQIAAAIEALRRDLEGEDRGVCLRPIAGGYRLSTKLELHEAVRRFVQSRPGFKLSMAALETLAIVAYKQPVTVPEILQIRGVKSTGAIRTLLEKRLIVPRGRKKVIGSPMQYGTGREFLEHFGLDSLQELPSLEEFEDIFGEKVEKFRQKSLFDVKARGIEFESGDAAPEAAPSPGEEE